MHPAHRAEAPFHAHRPGTLTLLRLVPWAEGARGHSVTGGSTRATGSRPHEETLGGPARSQRASRARHKDHRREAWCRYSPQVQRLTHRGQYHIGRLPGGAGLVYVLLAVVAVSVGAAVRAAPQG